MGHLFLTELGGIAWPNPGWGLIDTGPFIHINTTAPNPYWSSTGEAFNPGRVYDFHFGYGNQWTSDMGYTGYAWAVRDGDVAAVPEPGSLFLLGTGLSGMAFLRKRARRLHG